MEETFITFTAHHKHYIACQHGKSAKQMAPSLLQFSALNKQALAIKKAGCERQDLGSGFWAFIHFGKEGSFSDEAGKWLAF